MEVSDSGGEWRCCLWRWQDSLWGKQSISKSRFIYSLIRCPSACPWARRAWKSCWRFLKVSAVTPFISSQAGCSKLSYITPKNKVKEITPRFPWARKVNHGPDHCTQVIEIHVGHQPLCHFVLQIATIFSLSVAEKAPRTLQCAGGHSGLSKSLVMKSKQ